MDVSKALRCVVAASFICVNCASPSHGTEEQVIVFTNSGHGPVTDIEVESSDGTKIRVERIAPGGEITRLERSSLAEYVPLRWKSGDVAPNFKVSIRGAVPQRVARRGFWFQISDEALSVSASENWVLH